MRSRKRNRPFRRRMPWMDNKRWHVPSFPSSPPPLGNIIVTIHYNDLERPVDQDDTARITNSQYLTSYNWLSGKSASIIVPGEPPQWTPPSNPPSLRQDNGQYYCDPNAARYPAHPLEPMIQAILTDKPEFPVTDMDIVGCSFTLNNLLGFACGQDKSFRMLVEVVGKTVFFIRRGKSPTEMYDGVHGYGHTFPAAYTTWSASVAGSDSHQRVVAYDFAGMKCLVRFKADGYLPDLIPGAREKKEPLPLREFDPDEALPSIEGAEVPGTKMKEEILFPRYIIDPDEALPSIEGTRFSGTKEKEGFLFPRYIIDPDEALPSIEGAENRGIKMKEGFLFPRYIIDPDEALPFIEGEIPGTEEEGELLPPRNIIHPDEALPSIEGAEITDQQSNTPDMAPQKLNITRKGRHIPQSAVFDLKTRSHNKSREDVLGGELGRLWITQTPNFILAFHKYNEFRDIRVQNIQVDVQLFEEAEQPALGKFACLLQMLVEFARSSEDGKLEIQHEDGERFLNVRKPGGVVHGVLSPDTVRKWNE